MGFEGAQRLKGLSKNSPNLKMRTIMSPFLYVLKKGKYLFAGQLAEA